MLRVLLIILSVVSVILAYALGQPLLYLLALGLLAASALLTTAGMKKRHAEGPVSFMKAPEVQHEDLDSLGIMEIRPRDVSSSSVSAPRTQNRPAESEPAEGQQVLDFNSRADGSEGRDDVDSDYAPEPRTPTAQTESVPRVRRHPVGGRAEEDSADIIGGVRTKKPRARIMVSEAAGEVDADVLIPALRSLRAGLDAYTVCLLRQEEGLRYRVEAMVSQNSYARAQGSFSVSQPLMTDSEPFSVTVHSRLGGDGFAPGGLGYYHEPIAVRQVAMALVRLPSSPETYLLVVDTMHDGSLETASARLLVEQYARLLQTLLSTEIRRALESVAMRPEHKPRRDIIADEMQKARKDAQPLALALVFLNRGEEVSQKDDQAIGELESAFEERLREVVRAERIEKFGELTYGVFYRGDAARVAKWASHLQTSFVDAEGQLRGGVSVGVALLNPRHESPEDLRSDATAALQEAFQTGECTIVE